MKKRILSSILALTLLASTMMFGTITASAAERVNIEPGIYTIHSRLNYDMVLDISGGTTASGGNLQLYRYNGTPSQMFWIEKSGSSYTITPMCSGMKLDVQGGTMQSGTNVQQYYSNGSNAQKWKFYGAGNGYCYIGCGNFAIDAAGGKSSNGTNIQIYKPNGSAAQAWKLQKVNSPRYTDAFTAYTDSGSTCIVRISDSLLNKSGYQKASVKLNTYNSVNNKSTNGKVLVTVRTMSNILIWSGVKSGGDTIKLGDDYAAYKITIKNYDSGNGVFANGDDFINMGKTGKWGLTNQKNCQLYTEY